jgi:hypothetical protein
VKPSNLLLKLLSYLFPGVGGDGTVDQPNSDDPPPDDTDTDDDAPPDDTVDDDGSADDPPPQGQRGPGRREREIIELRERAQRAERERDEARNTPRGPAQPTPQQRQWDEEEAVLRNPESTEMQRWTVNSNRLLRQTQSQAAEALARAEDARDAAAFDRAAAKNPALFDKYRDKVEEIVKSERQAGRMVQRENVMAFVIGQAMMSGNLKSKPGNTGKTTNTVLRGQPNTNARSDVPRKGGQTEQEKRRARLENQII